ncbi:hypothetical protein FUAX_39050 (plasmid) [Fulvitalea axinellae]|uniref:DUF2147 domain-containing protein n=1 Tax=Fulvitalea axinellae TaxID=1182444 RepID=A0AAU9CMJ2_9BACT|nr:hypothetical protein FUAX_39050 [Fulvitalea axinellae]
MKRSLLILIFCCFATLSKGQTIKDDISGTWFTKTKNLKVEFFKSEGRYFGKIIWKSPENKTESRIGDVIISDLKYISPEAQYQSGKMRAKKFNLDCKVKKDSPNTIIITVSKAFMSRKLVWTKADR